MERDAWFYKFLSLCYDISTHTLTWSVTSIGLYSNDSVSTFQLTRSRGAWPTFHTLPFFENYFNSHAHVERDIFSLSFSSSSVISTHTLTWSVTNSQLALQGHCEISTHTLTWSVTHISHLAIFWELFQLTRSRGAWRKYLIGKVAEIVFQLTRSRGAWQHIS